MASLDEKIGIVPCYTPWGKWWQTIEEVYIEVLIEEGTKSKEIKVDIKPNSIKVGVKGKDLFSGDLFNTVHADEALWTLEDKKLIQICLPKCDAMAGNCWKSLLKMKYATDPDTFDKMEKQLTLQKFQIENPGFDFSGASITGNYHGGGPTM